MYTPTKEDIRALKQDKYGNAPDADLTTDLARLAEGEPLAYVIGWMPFLGLKVGLQSRPLIPRPETEWWTEMLIGRLREKHGDAPFSFLDLCAGSGAIGLAVLAHLPKARVAFSELDLRHADAIRGSIESNGLDASHADIRTGDLFAAIGPEERFDVIAANPPYVPEGRKLDAGVASYEPSLALYGGADGLALIRRIAREAPRRLAPGGELWCECDSTHAEAARSLFEAEGLATALHTDPYGRPRLVVAYFTS